MFPALEESESGWAFERFGGRVGQGIAAQRFNLSFLCNGAAQRIV